MDPYVGEIRCFGFNFAPVGWAQCNGQILAISQNTALFSLIGTYYGGNGTSNFQLPNLQDFVPIGQGDGPGLTPIVLGENGGETAHTLISNEMPLHNHGFPAKSGPAATAAPVAGSTVAIGHSGSRGSSVPVNFYTTQTPAFNINPNLVGPAGNNQPHNNIQPTLTMNWCIALVGVYPPRN